MDVCQAKVRTLPILLPIASLATLIGCQSVQEAAVGAVEFGGDEDDLQAHMGTSPADHHQSGATMILFWSGSVATLHKAVPEMAPLRPLCRAITTPILLVTACVSVTSGPKVLHGTDYIILR